MEDTKQIQMTTEEMAMFEQVWKQAAERVAQQAVRLGGFMHRDNMVEEIMYQIAAIVKRGGGYLTSPVSVQFGVQGVWGSDCSVELVISASIDRKGKPVLKTTGTVGWSSTRRTLAQSVATVEIYRRAIEFAGLAEAMLSC